jgi:SAM-dependent methyltransferase
MEHQLETVKEKFNQRWQSYAKGYDDFVKKMKNSDYIVNTDIAISQVHRALITDRYIKENFKKGSRVVEIGCGNGFNPCYLFQEGYDITAFDVSSSAINQACDLAKHQGAPEDIFHVGDHSILATFQDESVDVVVALGVMRYLEKSIREYIYQQVIRILKPKGCFLVTNDNQLFEIFAMNDGTIRFWGEVIEGFSDANELLPGVKITEALKEKVHLPQRQFAPHSVSQHIERHMENPLAYGEIVEAYGYKLEKIFYPDSHLLPPFLEKVVDQSALEAMKAKTCLSRADGDWRAMFMGSEFLSVLKN